MSPAQSNTSFRTPRFQRIWACSSPPTSVTGSLGTSDSFYCTQVAGVCGGAFPTGIPYKSYTNWDVGVGFTYKVFTLDLRYFDTNLNKGDCNAFTSDHTATGIATTPINPFPAPGSNWCGSALHRQVLRRHDRGGEPQIAEALAAGLA